LLSLMAERAAMRAEQWEARALAGTDGDSGAGTRNMPL
jgi:hypothetical protein